MTVIDNTLPERGTPLPADLARALGPGGADEAAALLAGWPGYEPTPLVSLDTLALALGLGALHVKDEGARGGIGSFKALGGAYAVLRVVLEHASAQLGRSVGRESLQSDDVRAVARGMTFACATDGNHGRSVAQGASRVGAASVVFVHAGVSGARAAAIAALGARIVRVAGTYDDSVAEAAAVADREGWTVVSDTAWPGYETIPLMVMQGYTVMAREALDQAMRLGPRPTHVFLQAGVGGMAAAVAAYVRQSLASPVRIIVVEPARAACVLASAAAGVPVRIPHGESTVMAMLECYEPSLVAWRVLAHTADVFMTVDEDDAVHAMRTLGAPTGRDPAIIAGESGGVGVAALLHAAHDDRLRRALALDTDARVLAFNTEGATDPARYKELVGT